MIENVDEIISDFIKEMRILGYQLNPEDLLHEYLPAPHNPSKLPKQKSAVYVYSLNNQWHKSNIRNRVLKVGKVGPKSNARYQYQHYKPKSAKSNLANSLIKSTYLWNYLGVKNLEKVNIEGWMKENLDRDNILIDQKIKNPKKIRGKLELYLKGILGPVFEG